MSTTALALLFTTGSLLPQAGPAPDLGTTETPPQKIDGRVTDGGRPVGGATVLLSWRKFPLPGGLSGRAHEVRVEVARTNDEGRFSTRIPPWRYCSIYAVKGRRVSSVVDKIRTPAPAVELALGPSQTITASLRHDGKIPPTRLAYRLVRVTSDEHAVPFWVTGRTRADGSLRFENLPRGLWRLMLAAAAYRLPRPVVFEAGKPAPPIALQRAVSIECRLVGSRDRKPIAGARIEQLDLSQYQECVSDENGRFTLHGLEVGPGATLLVEAEKHERKILVLEPGLSPLDEAPQATLALSPGGDVFGKILEPKGRPLGGVTVVAQCAIHPSGVTSHDLSVFLRTRADGTYRTQTLDPSGLYLLFAMLPSGELQQLGLRDPRPQFLHPDLGTFRLGSRRVEATIKLRTSDAGPIDVRLYGPLKGGDSREYQPLIETAKGTWLSPSMRPGAYSVMAVSPKLGIAREDVQIGGMQTGRATLPATLPLGQPKQLAGTVVGADARPIPNVEVTLVPHGGSATGTSQRWSDMVASDVMRDLFPKFPRQVVTATDGKFVLWCFESSGDYDLLFRRRDAPHGPAVEGQIDTKIEHALNQPMPIRVPINK